MIIISKLFHQLYLKDLRLNRHDARTKEVKHRAIFMFKSEIETDKAFQKVVDT